MTPLIIAYKKFEIYLLTIFRLNVSIHGTRYTYFWKQTAEILEFYFPFRLWAYFISHNNDVSASDYRISFKFYPNRTIPADYNVIALKLLKQQQPEPVSAGVCSARVGLRCQVVCYSSTRLSTLFSIEYSNHRRWSYIERNRRTIKLAIVGGKAHMLAGSWQRH